MNEDPDTYLMYGPALRVKWYEEKDGKRDSGGIKLKEHRLFATKEEAEASIPKVKPKYRSPYE